MSADDLVCHRSMTLLGLLGIVVCMVRGQDLCKLLLGKCLYLCIVVTSIRVSASVDWCITACL